MDKGILLNDMEDSNNNIDNSAILKELQALNKGIDALTENQEVLTEFIINKDKEEKEEQEQKQEEELKKEEETKQEQTKADQESTRQAETYTETLEQISDNVNVTNHLLAGQNFFLGVVVGVLLIKILFDRFTTKL